MKRIKSINLLILLTIFLSTFSFIKPASAAGSVTVGFDGNSTVAVGDEITLALYVDNITGASGGVESFEANLVFDSEYLEYVSGTGTSNPYRYQINVNNNYKIAGLDTYLDSGITSQTTIFTFVFKALKPGSTQVSLSNLKVTDASARLSASASAKQIVISDNTPIAASSDATLKDLQVNNYTLSPAFDSETTSYTVTVPNDETSVTIIGAVNDDKATVSGLGNVSLTNDTTTRTITVTAEDGTKKEYVITIEKDKSSEPSDDTPTPTPGGDDTPEEKSSDADLLNLSVSGYTLSPAFDKNTTTYTVTIPNEATKITIVGEANNSKATITGLGNFDIPSDEDNPSKVITVTAEDGTKKNYTINVVKIKEEVPSKDSDSSLKELDIEGYELSPKFDKDTTSYSMKVKNNVTSLDVSAIPNSDKASVSITGNKNWKEGVNTVTIKVTAEDGSLSTYQVNVTRESSSTTTPAASTPKSSDNALKSLIINSSHEITPAFNKNISSYNVTVPYSVDKLDLNYVTNSSKAVVTITGNRNFKVGEVNVVEIDVAAEDGSIRTYILNVTRSTKESDNDLKELDVKGTKLSPAFNPEVLEYSVEVPNGADKLDIEATSASKDSKIEIIGNENLKEGHNTILIKVTDKDGFTKYYTIDADKTSSNGTILGFKPLNFFLFLGLLLLLFLIFFFLIFLMLKRDKKDDNDTRTDIRNEKSAPIIEVKPEFNFGSKNSSDDDVVYGNMNQASTVSGELKAPEKDKPQALEAKYEEIEDQVPYDPYDEVVTKKELIDAIHEASEKKDTTKLQMLLEQEELNRRKKELKDKEEKNNDKNEKGWR